MRRMGAWYGGGGAGARRKGGMWDGNQAPTAPKCTEMAPVTGERENETRELRARTAASHRAAHAAQRRSGPRAHCRSTEVARAVARETVRSRMFSWCVRARERDRDFATGANLLPAAHHGPPPESNRGDGYHPGSTVQLLLMTSCRRLGESWVGLVRRAVG